MFQTFRELVKYRELLYMITWRDIHIKYKQSVMGLMWAVFMPMLIVASGVLVRLAMAKISGTQLELAQVVSVSVKAVPYAFFIASIRFCTSSLVGNSNLVGKIYFPREILPLSAVLSQLFDLSIAATVLIIFLVIAKTGLSIYLLWVIPLIIILILFATTLGIMLSAANLFFRDVKYLVEVILNFAIFFTPVFFDASFLGKWEPLILINPVSPILEGLNSSILLHRSPDLAWVGYSAAVSVIGVLVALKIFDKIEYKFAESI